MDSADPNDPRGYLNAVPELSTLQRYPEIVAALASGQPSKLWDALTRVRRSGSAADHPLIDKLLATRRLFVEPIKSPPSMFTLNGFGTRLYGQDQRDPQDGTYIATLFLTALFIPVVPLSQYLVRGVEGNRYQFFGKVPLSRITRLWQRGALLAMAVLAIVIGASTWQGGHRADVHFINGLDVPVKISAGPAQLRIPPGERRTYQLDTGEYPVKTTDEAGTVIEEQVLRVPAFTDVVAYNVLGAGPVYVEDVVYSTTSTDQANQARLLAGSVLALDGVSYAFVEPPQQIQMSGTRETRRHVGLANGGWKAMASQLLREGRGEEAASLAERIARVESTDPRACRAIGELVRRARGLDAALPLMREAAERFPDERESHRQYQRYLVMAGKADEALRLYGERYKREPDSALAGYLWAQLQPVEQALPLLRKLSAQFPDDAEIARSMLWTSFASGRFKDALELASRFEPPPASLHVRSLVALGRMQEALDAAAKYGEAPELHDLDYAMLYARLVKIAGKAKPPVTTQKLIMRVEWPTTDVERQAFYAARLGEEVPKQSIRDPSTRQALQLEVAVHRSAAEAVKLAKGANPDVLELLDHPTVLLIATEALRSGEDKHGARLLDLLYGSPLSAQAVKQYLRTGEPSAEITHLDPEWRAALALVRGRALEAEGKSAAALYAQARKDDIVPGIVTHALEHWERPSSAAASTTPP